MKKRTFRALLCLGLFAMTLTSCGNTNPYADDPRYPIYQLALESGFTGTYQEWLDSIKGEDGQNGETPHIGENGNWWIGDTDTGVPARGPEGPQGPAGSDGQPGSQGEPGKDGNTPYIGENGNWWIGDTDTGVPATGSDGQPGSQGPVGPEGPQGEPGKDGKDGKDGIDGKDGTSMHTGHGAPSSDLGQVGDSYVDLDTWDFYVKYENGWVLEGNIKGSDATSTPDYEGTEGLEFYPLNDKECAVGVGTARYFENIVIPSKYKQYTVTQIGHVSDDFSGYGTVVCILNGFSSCENLKTVTLPDTITTIGTYAFYQCAKLTTINLPDNLTSIGDYAFTSCASLASIDIPDGVTSIAEGSFQNCTSLASVDLPDNLTTIGRFAFENCKSLTSIDLPDSLETIDEYAFSYCSLNTIRLPINISYVGSQCFSGNTSLTIELYYKISTINWGYNWAGNSKIVYYGSEGEVEGEGSIKEKITVYAPASEHEYISHVVESYNDKQPSDGTRFNINLIASESYESFQSVALDPSSSDAPDLFYCVDDIFVSGMKNILFSKVPNKYSSDIKENNPDTSVNAIKYNDELYGYPSNLSNGYFLWYDSYELDSEQVQSLETILQVAQSKGKKVSIELTNGWYSSMFLMSPQACGTDSLRYDFDAATGKGETYVNWDNETGVKVAEYINGLLQPYYENGTLVCNGGNDVIEDGFKDGSMIAAVTGTWMETSLKAACSTIAATKLPTYTIDGVKHQASTFTTTNCYFVNPHQDELSQNTAHELAYLLTNTTGQFTRLNYNCTSIPSNINAAESAQFRENASIGAKALSEQLLGAAVCQSRAVGNNNGYWDIGQMIGRAYIEGLTYYANWSDFLKQLMNDLRNYPY